MAINYKAYEHSDGTVVFAREDSEAAAILDASIESQPTVPGLSMEVEEDGSAMPQEPAPALAFVSTGFNGAENVNLPEPFQFQVYDVFLAELEGQTDFTLAVDGIVANFNGYVEVTAQPEFWTAGTNPQRPAPQVHITLNGEQQRNRARHTYIRSNSGHNNSTGNVTEILKVSSDDVIGTSSQIGAVAGTVNLAGDTGGIIVKRLS
jgi:hypothetical protein